jgi:hypothetical protein
MENLDLLIPCLPQAAWRLLLEMLQCDCGFCQAAVPYFHACGYVALYISRKPLHVLRGAPVVASEPSGGERNTFRRCHAAILAVRVKGCQEG